MRMTDEQQQKISLNGMIYKIAALLILLGFLVGAYNANKSYAWFTDSENVPFSLESGKVHYEVDYTTGGGLMVPGKNLFTDFKLTNKSSIDTNVRLQLKYTIWEENASGDAVSKSAIYAENGSETGAAADQYLNLNLNMDPGAFALKSISSGNSDLAGEWWTYETTVSAVSLDAIDIGEKLEVFKDPIQFCYDGPKTGNIFAGRPVTIVIRLQAKQADHLEWADLTMVETFSGKDGL